ncbi:unnamed protein product [Didymodactylos carnosus]|uniref:Repressor of RNA polymerase III transcription MAF1 n=1 Tax=Didymodactylos carnosus TaxID=1234261 RepID=A0A813RWS3_9BILA|nr:unnamed protein product [Didymodactylos carnosus]CAF0914563.1 unnamed protein product [Didymodactylos carnosus]CAF3572850.1 unnamed protein product [Didymodactylos carnosus]CAF3693112.1 unnamed protein product [Didymodactylos carnosus]
MKLLENSKLEAISSALSVDTPVCEITTRLESYSCKMAGDHKKLYKQLTNEPGTTPHDLQILGPSQTMLLSTSPAYVYSISSSGDEDSPLNKTIPRKTLIYLISTLNASFEPDYDFSSCTSHEFSRETNIDLVKNAVDSRLLSGMGDRYSPLSSHLWSVIDEEINIKECEMYSYCPDGASDPFSEYGIVWSFNFFFYNRKLRRILFLTCRAESKNANEQRDGDGNMDYNYLAFEGVMD